MIVSFYKMDKRLNSTKLPSSAPFVEYTSVILKSPSSVVNPTIAIVEKGVGNPVPYKCNYAYIADYGRYYWVDNWTFQDHQWVASLRVDPLATYKTQIGAESKYVLRAASDYNPEVVDTLYPATSEYLQTYASPFTLSSWSNYGDTNSPGNYVVTVVGKDNASGSNAAVAMFNLQGTSVQQLINNMMNAIDGTLNGMQSARDIGESLYNILLAPSRLTDDLSKYICNIMWFPWSFATNGAAGSGNLYLGMYNCLPNQWPISSPMRVDSVTVSLAGIPAAGAEPWEYLAPFANYYLDWQPFGVIPLDPVDVVNCAELLLTVTVDAMSGLGLLEVRANETAGVPGRIVATRTAQVGVAVPYGGTAPNYAGAITGAMSVASTASAWLNGNASGGELAGAIGSAASASSPNGFSSGTSGGGAGIHRSGAVYGRIMKHTDTDPTEHGRPLCEIRTLNTLSGYVKCADGHISASGATQAELAAVESYLTGGFFYE